MNEHTKRRIDNFKNKIGYDSALKEVDKSKAVVFRDFNPRKWNFLQDFKSSVPLKDNVHVYENGISKELIFDTGENDLYVTIFITSSSHEVVMEKLLNEALSTSMMVSLYEKCPYDLGNINISTIENDIYHIKWTFLNTFFAVDYKEKKVDVEKFCHELQHYTENFVVGDIERYRPQFDEIIISSTVIKMGELTTIYIVPAYGKAFTGQKDVQKGNFALEANWKANILSLEKEKCFFFRFKGIAEGTETISFILADLDALVCSKYEVSITVNK